MEIWLDTIDLNVIADAEKTGILSGVTTNPSILSSTRAISKTLSAILDIQSGPVAVQVTSQDPQGMVEEGRRIFAFSSRMLIKVPIDRSGLIAIKQLKQENIPVLGTGIILSSQALLASCLEVEWIALYFSHISAVGDPFEALKTMAALLRSSSTKILAASLKELDHVIYCASLGVDAVTIKPDLYDKLIEAHPLVEGFSKKFLSDWKQVHGELSINEVLEHPLGS
jgi:TalC/MipB family fructose-6-phosphate aldolase